MNPLIVEVDDKHDVEDLFRQQFRRDIRAGRILSDVNMPGMSGLELLEKAKVSRPDVPVIMITAYGEDETRRIALEEGAAALLMKPNDFAALRVPVLSVRHGTGATRLSETSRTFGRLAVTRIKLSRCASQRRSTSFSEAASVLQTRPVTGSSAPVTALAPSLARKRMTSASCLGATHLAGSAFGMLARFAAVSMIDGSTAFTVILPFSSAASDSVSLCTPAFDAA